MRVVLYGAKDIWAPHDKTQQNDVRPAKTQYSLGIRY